jgi:hypothetical protein
MISRLEVRPSKAGVGSMNKKQQVPTKPFFTRFLEKQELRGVAGGGPLHTLKFPSDNDETADDK